MNPKNKRLKDYQQGIPRVSGDEPGKNLMNYSRQEYSPRERG